MVSKHFGITTCMLTSPIGDLELTCCLKGVHSLSLPELPSDSHYQPDLRFLCFSIMCGNITSWQKINLGLEIILIKLNFHPESLEKLQTVF